MNSIKSILLFLLSVLVSIFLLELGSRLILPISPGAKKMSLDNEKILQIAFNEPMTSYLQVSSEYSVNTKIDKNGNRITKNSLDQADETFIFLGDSFTFGQGVSDEATIPSQFCTKIKAECVNLGVPGTGIINHYLKLKEFLKYKNIEKKTTVVHLILASTTSRHPGNDIMDSIIEAQARNTDHIITDGDKVTDPGAVINFARWLSRNSNAFRMVRTIFGNQLRYFAWRNNDANIFTNDELAIFKDEQHRIKKVLDENKIKYFPVLLSTYAELESGNMQKTKSDLENLTSIKQIEGFTKGQDYKSFFYPYDGHTNKFGNEHITNNLISHLKPVR